MEDRVKLWSLKFPYSMKSACVTTHNFLDSQRPQCFSLEPDVFSCALELFLHMVCQLSQHQAFSGSSSQLALSNSQVTSFFIQLLSLIFPSLEKKQNNAFFTPSYFHVLEIQGHKIIKGNMNTRFSLPLKSLSMNSLLLLHLQRSMSFPHPTLKRTFSIPG